MAEQKEIFLYRITNPLGKIYIGQTVNPRIRFQVYARAAIPFQHRLRNSILKYGWEYHTTEILTSFPQSEIDYAEKYMIAWHNSTGKEGLNVLEGGQIRLTTEHHKRHSEFMTGRKHTEETKRKIGLKSKGNQHAKGKTRSEEFRKNVSEKLKGINRKGNPNYLKHKQKSNGGE